MNQTFVLRQESNAQALWAFLKANWRAMADAGKPLALHVTEAKSKRSDAQNRLLHATLTEIANNAWVKGKQYDMETWKEFFRQKFIGTEEYELPDGRRAQRGISTTKLSVSECADFITHIQMYAADELGLELV
jgi:hypothetical protein